jgi:hypothetical protein
MGPFQAKKSGWKNRLKKKISAPFLCTEKPIFKAQYFLKKIR